MKTLLISRLLLTFVAIASVSLAHAAPTSARYLRFDGYASTDNGQINIYETEAYAGAVNVARTGTVTANSAQGSTALLIDGDTTSNRFSTDRNNPGQPSVASPHRIQVDFGSVQAIDQIRVFFEGSQVYSFGLFLSVDGVAWTPVGRYTDVNGLVTCSVSVSGPLVVDMPVPVVLSAAMRPGTTLMDVVYRVNYLDNATVKVRALAFINGTRSFANVIRPVTFVEGTAANLGDAITTNTPHTLTWNVGADWNIDLGQVKFEILCRDGRGLLAFDWISIPAAGGNAAVSVSKDTPSAASALSAFFWQYASGDAGLTLTSSLLAGSASSGNFAGIPLVSGASIQSYGPPYLFKQMNLDPASASDVNYAADTARAGLLNSGNWHAANRNYGGISVVQGWGGNQYGQTTIAAGLSGVTAIAAGGQHSLALRNDGTLVAWGYNANGQNTIPTGLSGVTAISISTFVNLARKNDGTVVAWGSNAWGQTAIPAGLSGVIAVAAGGEHSLALKNDGTVVVWGYNGQGQVNGTPNTPESNAVANPVTLNGSLLNGITSIAAGTEFSLALKNNGTVVAWGRNAEGQTNVPSGLTGVTAITAGADHSLALKNDGTVVAWGYNGSGETTIPAGLTGVTAIAAGAGYSIALKNDGTVVAWGTPGYGVTSVPPGLTGVTAIAAGGNHILTLKVTAP